MEKLFRTLLFLALVGGIEQADAAAPAKPNIVFILADDLGYGDVKCLNPAGQIPTPHLDPLGAAGIIFTDAHSSSAVCTPTRYGLLTGHYNWRSHLKSGVQGGMSPPLIEPGRLTVPAFLKQHGYHTACIGKWNLGMDWPLTQKRWTNCMPSPPARHLDRIALHSSVHSSGSRRTSPHPASIRTQRLSELHGPAAQETRPVNSDGSIPLPGGML